MTTSPVSPYLYVGGSGSVYALEKLTGDIVWRVELKSGWVKTGSSFVTLAEGRDYLFAFAYGIAFCLEKLSGNILWRSEIKELKHYISSLAVDATLLGGAVTGSAWTDASTSAAGDGDGSGGGDGNGGGDGGGGD